MIDKYHRKWIRNNFECKLRIFKAQERSFTFTRELAEDTAEVFKTLSGHGVDTVLSMETYTYLFDLVCYYYTISNGIGKCFVEVVS